MYFVVSIANSLSKTRISTILSFGRGGGGGGGDYLIQYKNN